GRQFASPRSCGSAANVEPVAGGDPGRSAERRCGNAGDHAGQRQLCSQCNHPPHRGGTHSDGIAQRRGCCHAAVAVESGVFEWRGSRTMMGSCRRLFSANPMPRERSTTRLLILLPLLLSTICTHTAMGQTASGTLRGQVSDPSGAVIPGATVSATPATGQARTAQTDGQGNYELSGLVPG